MGNVDRIATPGAETSGFINLCPFKVTEPRLLKLAIVSDESVAPTVIELISSPGHQIVEAPGPLFPAHITGITPAATALIIAVAFVT